MLRFCVTISSDLPTSHGSQAKRIMLQSSTLLYNIIHRLHLIRGESDNSFKQSGDKIILNMCFFTHKINLRVGPEYVVQLCPDMGVS